MNGAGRDVQVVKERDKPRGGDRRRSILRRAAPIAAVAAALALFFALGLHRYFTIESLRENRETLRAWAAASPVLAIGLFMLVYAAAVAISFPGATILTVFGGYLFGLWPGVPAIIVAATFGACVIFLASRTALGDLLGKFAGRFVKRMEQGFRENELNYIFVLRLIPVFPFWAINIAAGVLGVRLRNFLIGTFFGIIPGVFVYASIGNAAGAAFDAGESVTLKGMLLKPEILLPIAGLVLLALIPVLLKRFNRQAAKLDKPPA